MDFSERNEDSSAMRKERVAIDEVEIIDWVPLGVRHNAQSEERVFVPKTIGYHIVESVWLTELLGGGIDGG